PGRWFRDLVPHVCPVPAVCLLPGLADTHRGSDLASRRARVRHPVLPGGLARSLRTTRRVGRLRHRDHSTPRRLVLEASFPLQAVRRVEGAGNPGPGDGRAPWVSRLGDPRRRPVRGRIAPPHGPVPAEFDPDFCRAVAADLSPDLPAPCSAGSALTEPSFL